MDQYLPEVEQMQSVIYVEQLFMLQFSLEVRSIKERLCALYVWNLWKWMQLPLQFFPNVINDIFRYIILKIQHHSISGCIITQPRNLHSSNKPALSCPFINRNENGLLCCFHLLAKSFMCVKYSLFCGVIFLFLHAMIFLGILVEMGRFCIMLHTTSGLEMRLYEEWVVYNISEMFKKTTKSFTQCTSLLLVIFANIAFSE